MTNHGKNGFTTKIEVNHFTANANGFQELPTAFTYKDPAGNEFTAGHYIVGTSILPGQNAAAEPPPEHLPARAAQGKPKSKPKKKKATAKTAGTKKSKGKRRR